MKLDLEGIQADSLVGMLKASYTLENWEGIVLIADKLYLEINNIYETNEVSHAPVKNHNVLGLNRSIVYYFGYSMCLKGIALRKQGNNSESRACIKKYAELGWINAIHEEDLQEVEYYKSIAKANTYVIDLLEGRIVVLDEYIDFLRNNKDEMLPGLIHVLESSIKYNFSVDSILAEFQDVIDSMSEYYKTKRNIRYYNDYIYLLGKYYSKRENKVDALNTVLNALTSSVNLKDDIGFKKAVALFEVLREYATLIQLEQYKNIMITIIEKNGS